jgi:hypothetical protein
MPAHQQSLEGGVDLYAARGHFPAFLRLRGRTGVIVTRTRTGFSLSIMSALISALLRTAKIIGLPSS